MGNARGINNSVARVHGLLIVTDRPAGTGMISGRTQQRTHKLHASVAQPDSGRPRRP